MKTLVQQVAQAREAQVQSLRRFEKLEAELRELRKAVGESARTQVAGVILKTFRTWRSGTKKATSRRRKHAKLLQNWRCRETRAAFLAWYSKVVE